MTKTIGPKLFTATYKDCTAAGVTKIDAVCAAVALAGDTLSMRYVPYGITMQAIVELQLADKKEARVRTAEYADIAPEDQLATPATLAQEKSKSDNKFAEGYEDRLYDAAISELGNKVKIAAIKAEKAADNIA